MLKLLPIVVALGCGSSSSAPGQGSGSAPPKADEATVLRNSAFQINGHITVMKNTADFTEYRDVIATAKQIAGVVSAEPFLFGEAAATSPASDGPIEIAMKGIDPATTTRHAQLVKDGTFILATKDEAPPRIVIAEGVAKSLVAKVGDDIMLTEQLLDPAFDKRVPRPQVFRVAGVIRTGVEPYDQQLTFVALDAHQEMFDRGDTVIGIEIRVSDYKQSAAIAKRLGAELGPRYVVEDWRTINPGLAN